MKLVIFDCDGTLVDSQHLIVSAMADAFRSQDLAPPPRTAILGIVGLSLPEAIFRLAPEQEEPTVLSISEAYKHAFGQLRLNPDNLEPLYDGAEEVVSDLTVKDGLRLGIATGKSRRGVDRVLGAHGLLSHFSTIQTADDAPSKPHPAMIEQAMLEVDVAPDETVMIGDTSYDMEMARRAGARAIGVAWGYHPEAELTAAGADYVASDFVELLVRLRDMRQ